MTKCYATYSMVGLESSFQICNREILWSLRHPQNIHPHIHTPILYCPERFPGIPDEWSLRGGFEEAPHMNWYFLQRGEGWNTTWIGVALGTQKVYLLFFQLGGMKHLTDLLSQTSTGDHVPLVHVVVAVLPLRSYPSRHSILFLYLLLYQPLVVSFTLGICGSMQAVSSEEERRGLPWRLYFFYISLATNISKDFKSKCSTTLNLKKKKSQSFSFFDINIEHHRSDT